MYISKRSGTDHTVLPANTPCLPFLRMRSPDNATSSWGKGHPIAAYYSSIDPEEMKGWVGLVGWPIVDGLPTEVVTSQLQVERRAGKVRRPKTDVLPLCHATNQPNIVIWCQLVVDIVHPGFCLPRRTWCALNCFRTGPGLCAANLHKWAAGRPVTSANVGGPNNVSHSKWMSKDNGFWRWSTKTLHSASNDAVNLLEWKATNALALWMNCLSSSGDVAVARQLRCHEKEENWPSCCCNWVSSDSRSAMLTEKDDEHSIVCTPHITHTHAHTRTFDTRSILHIPEITFSYI